MQGCCCCAVLTVAMCMKGQVVGSILFASNASSKAGAVVQAASLVANGSTYNSLLTQSAATSLNSWMSSNTSASLLGNGSYAGVAVPANFSYTYLNVTNVQVLNASVASDTVESLLGLSSSAQHYAMTIWMNITVLVGYSVGVNASSTSGRRLLQASDSMHAHSEPFRSVEDGMMTQIDGGIQGILQWVQLHEQSLHAQQRQHDLHALQQMLSQASIGTNRQTGQLPTRPTIIHQSHNGQIASSLAPAPPLHRRHLSVQHISSFDGSEHFHPSQWSPRDLQNAVSCQPEQPRLSLQQPQDSAEPLQRSLSPESHQLQLEIPYQQHSPSDRFALSGHSATQLQSAFSHASHQPQHSARQLKSALSYSWQSPLSLQLKLFEKAFLDMSVCNATLVAQQLSLNSSVSSLNCTNSTALTLLTNLLSAASTAGSSPPLSVLMIADSPSSTQSTSSVNANSGLEASVRSTVNIMLQNYDKQIAQLLAMALTELNAVTTIQGALSIKKTYIKKFITTAQNYITVTTSFVETALTLFGITVTSSNSNSRSASTYTQLVQSTLADDAEAANTLYASASFQAAVKALAPTCNRDSLGSQRFYFGVAADQSQENVAANSTVTASAGTDTVTLNETASQCPGKLVDKKTGYCVDVWGGYPVVQVSSMPSAKAIGERVRGHRYTVGWSGNVVVGGLLLHQV